MIHLFPLKRAVSREIAESRALFLARSAATYRTDSPAFRATLEQLEKSENAAVRREAKRIKEIIHVPPSP